MRITQTLAAAACAVFAAFPTPVYSMTTREVEVVCPIDGERFKTVTVLSGTQFGMGLDLKPTGATAAPWPLAKCPSSGFVIYKKEFSRAELSKLQAIVQGAEYRALVPIHTKYFLAAKLKAAMGDPVSSIAASHLHATWEARTTDEYRIYATAALAVFELVLMAKNHSEDEGLTATLVAGELERRLGLFEKSKNRFLGIPNRETLRAPMDKIVKLQLQLIEQKNQEPALIPD